MMYDFPNGKDKKQGSKGKALKNVPLHLPSLLIQQNVAPSLKKERVETEQAIS